MSAEENRALLYHYINEIWDQRNLAGMENSLNNGGAPDLLDLVQQLGAEISVKLSSQ